MGSWSPNCNAHTRSSKFCLIHGSTENDKSVSFHKRLISFLGFANALSTFNVPKTPQDSGKRILFISRPTGWKPQDAWDQKTKTRDKKQNCAKRTKVNEFPIMATRRSSGQKPRPASTVKKTFFKQRSAKKTCRFTRECELKRQSMKTP